MVQKIQSKRSISDIYMQGWQSFLLESFRKIASLDELQNPANKYLLINVFMQKLSLDGKLLNLKTFRFRKSTRGRSCCPQYLLSRRFEK